MSDPRSHSVADERLTSGQEALLYPAAVHPAGFRHIFTPTDPEATRCDLAGGKALQLAWLAGQGFQVPGFIILGSSLFTELLRANGLTRWYEESVHSIDQHDGLPELLKGLRERIASMAWTAPLQQELKRSLKSAGIGEAGAFAVRSSISDEDAPDASFAGQMDSFMFRRSITDLMEAYLQVMASMFSDRAIHYRLTQGIPVARVRGAAIVQVMIDSDVSGVMFTTHPVNGDRMEMLISATYGQGEGLVSGYCNADEYTVSLSSGSISKTKACKDVRLVPDHGEGKGIVPQTVPESLQNLPALSDEWITRIAGVGREISGNRGSPQDVEFCIHDEQLYILQTRPVTHLPAPANPRGQETVWDNSNIQESYCGITSPLTFSFASRIYATVYTQTFRILGFPERRIRENSKLVNNLLGLIRGRVYYNINNWYEGLAQLPSFRTNKADMEKMMGLQDPVDFVQDKELSFAEKLQKLPSMVMLLARFLISFARMDRLIEGFLKNFKEQTEAIDRRDLHRLEVSGLFDLLEEIDRNIAQKWNAPIINDFFVMMMNGRVSRHLKKAGFENPDMIQNNLMSGEPGVESTEPTKFLISLADTIKKDKRLRDLFGQYKDSEMPGVLRCTAPEVFARCEEYIAKYGDRCMGELKLESVSLHEDPGFMYSVLRNFIANDDLSLEGIESKEAATRRAAEEEAFHKVRLKNGRWGLIRFRRDLRKLRKAVKYRENTRFARTRLFGLIRAIYRQMGEQLAFYGILEKPRDIFLLTVDELDAYHEGRSVQTNLKALCDIRRREWQEYETSEPAHHFSTRGPAYYHNSFAYNGKLATPFSVDGNYLQGTGCYPGEVHGRVRKIVSPRDELNLDGRILCTVRTDPGWTPLFPTAGGILVERGSTLSHSAVIARELGIPAIVGIPGLTETLADQELVTMNGSTGTIIPHGGGNDA